MDGKRKDPRNIVIPSIRRNEKTYLFRNADPPVSIVGTKLFQSGFKCLNENFIRLSTARKIIFYCIYFSPFFLFFFFLSIGQRIVRNPVWSTSKGGRFHGKISCVRSDVNTLTLSPRECLEWMSSRCSTFLYLYLPVVAVFLLAFAKSTQ